MASAGQHSKLLYTSQPFFFSQPASLAAMAALYGVETAPVETARVLELGCASGGNIIPMAARFPKASFVGVDIEAAEITEGERRIAALRLSNIQLEAADIVAFAERKEEFDYVICHGVLSWVPEPVQDAVFRLCRTQLSPRGLIVISFNVLPGWRLEQMIRDICFAALDPTADPLRNVSRAMARLEAIAAGTQERTPYGFLTRQAAQRLAQADPTYLLAEHLAPVNDPFLFEDILTLAREAGLHYVSDAELTTSLPEAVLPHAAVKARALANGNAAHLQSYLDQMSGRSFRRAIFAKRAARAEPNADAFANLHASLALHRDASSPRAFHTASGHTYTAPNDLVADAFGELAKAYPATRLISDLAPPEALENSVMFLAAAGHLRVQTTPLRTGLASAAKPIAFSVARLEAVQRPPWVTTLRHFSASLSPDAMALLPHLDGSRDQNALAEMLQGQDRMARVDAALGLLEREALLEACDGTFG
jgi:protein-L-isoaspartate O-methyltransferase